MNWVSNNISSIGLIADIIGCLIIYKFGLPENVNKNGHINLILEQTNDNEIEKFKSYKRLSNVGLTLLLIGFIFQLIGNLI
jgi:hypothetical protein